MAHSAWQDDSLIIKVCSLRRHHTGTQKEKHTAVDLCKNIDLHRPHTHTHSETFGSACTLFFFFLHTDKCMYTLHTCLCWGSFLMFISSFFNNYCTLPFPPTLPVSVCPPHRGDFTQSEIQRCQHMSLAINLCHGATLTWLPVLNTLP